MNKKERMYQQIENHGANLNAIFETGLDAAKKFLNNAIAKAEGK